MPNSKPCKGQGGNTPGASRDTVNFSAHPHASVWAGNDSPEFQRLYDRYLIDYGVSDRAGMRLIRSLVALDLEMQHLDQRKNAIRAEENRRPVTRAEFANYGVTVSAACSQELDALATMTDEDFKNEQQFGLWLEEAIQQWKRETTLDLEQMQKTAPGLYLAILQETVLIQSDPCVAIDHAKLLKAQFEREDGSLTAFIPWVLRMLQQQHVARQVAYQYRDCWLPAMAEIRRVRIDKRLALINWQKQYSQVNDDYHKTLNSFDKHMANIQKLLSQ